MRVYWELARLGFRRQATYRMAAVAGVFTNTVFGFLISFVNLALYTAHGRVGGYDSTDALTYVWVTQGLLMTVYISTGWADIAQRVRTGDIATDFHRPVDFQAYWLTQDLGRAAYHMVVRGIPPILLAGFVFSLRYPLNPLTWVLFLVSVGLAVCISFALRFLVNLASFWLLDYRGIVTITGFAWPFLAGMYGIPLVFLPDWLYRPLSLLPFAGMGQTPMSIYLERPAAVPGILLQAAWAVALLAAGRLVLVRAERRLVVQGG